MFVIHTTAPWDRREKKIRNSEKAVSGRRREKLNEGRLKHSQNFLETEGRGRRATVPLWKGGGKRGRVKICLTKKKRRGKEWGKKDLLDQLLNNPSAIGEGGRRSPTSSRAGRVGERQKREKMNGEFS